MKNLGQNLNQKFEKFFDHNEFNGHQRSSTISELRKAYQVSEDDQSIKNLSYVFSHGLSQSDVALLFSQLSSFFELGFRFRKVGHRGFEAIQVFIFSLQLNRLDGLPVVQLPNAELYSVLKTNANAFLKKLKLVDCDPQNRMSAVLMPVSLNENWVLLSGLADPWLKMRVQALQDSLMKIQFP